MKFFKEIALVAATTLLAGLPAPASANSMVELTYQASQIQCGSNGELLNVLVDVYHNGELVKGDLTVNDSVMVPDFDGVELDYKLAQDADSCGLSTPSSLLLGQNDQAPNLPGAFSQDAIASLVADLEEYEELFLVELGTTNTSSAAYDLQDVVVVVNSNPNITNNNPVGPIAFAD